MITKKVQYGDELGEVVFEKRPQNRSIRIIVKSGGRIKVTLPTYVAFGVAEDFLMRKRDDIIGLRHKALSQAVATSLPTAAKERALAELRRRAQEILPTRTLQMYRLMSSKVRIRNKYGEVVTDPFRYNKVTIKNNATNWGSCSFRRNINLNMHLVELPAELMDYVIAHELCHLVYRNHGPKFHALLDAITDGRERELSRRLSKIRL